MICNRSVKFFSVVFVLLLYVVHVVSADDSCDELPIIKNGYIVLNDRNPPFRVNDIITYKCNDSFRTDETNPFVTCVLKDNVANWTEGACKKIVISCHDPGYIDNANRIGNMFTFPHNITYVCDEGYRMNGIATKYCSKSGHWQPPSNPYCEEILCPALIPLQNGEILPTNRRPYSVAVHKCDRNYKLVGDSNRECQADGTWSGRNPTCEKITCMAPGKFPNGRIVGKNVPVYNASDIIIFQCIDDSHHRISSKCLENGEWSVRPPTCAGTTVPAVDVVTPVAVDDSTNDSIEDEVKSCEDPGKIKNGVRTSAGLHINSTITYMCDEGYQLKGKPTLLCLENGKWDLDKLPMCVKPLSIPTVIGIVFGVAILICIVVGGYFWYRYRMKSRGYGEKSKALTADATDIEEIAGLDRDKKQIPVTVL